MTPPATRSGLLRALRERLAAAPDIARPEQEARWLLGHVLNLDDTALALDPHAAVSPEEAARLEAFAARRIAGEPLARLLGTWEFWGLPMRLSAATLVPRADSETLIEAALARLDTQGRRRERWRALDLGTGSGCLLLALLHEAPLATGLGIDRAPDAVATARDNAARLGLSGRALFRTGDWAAGVDERFDVVLSNPPYIPSADIATLETAVREHDPHLALDGGADGLDAYRRIAAALPGLLAPEGFAVLEHGHDQREAVAAILGDAGLAVVESRSDLAGLPRALLATMP